MRVSALISQLQKMQDEFGDLDVFMDVSSDGLLDIGDVGVDVEDTGIILWKIDEDE